MKGLLRKTILLIGDWAGLYFALFLLVAIRYTSDWQIWWRVHLHPFSLIFLIWIVTLYGSYLYETRFLRFGVDTVRAIGTAVTIALFASITAFYVFPPGLIHPRRNMVIFAAIYGVILILWRWSFYRIVRKRIQTNLLFMGGGMEVKELNEYFKNNPHLGYTSMGEISTTGENIESIEKKIKYENIKLIVVGGKEGGKFTKDLFPLLSSGATVMELEEFYERVLNKVSHDVFTDLWFIKNLENINAEVYKIAKRLSDIVISFAGLPFLLVLYLPIGLIIKIDSPGPIIFKQKRVGKNNKTFMMYKFRTMKALSTDGSAETGEAMWSSKGDKRITKFGNILRKTRLDELPQFWNIFIGDMSFVGPRPERPEFVEKLSREIPYYGMRHLVRPGLTGWAQINFEYGDSVEDARIKLQYDIYYAKKRSIALDLAIILKTIKTVLTGQGQ